MTPAPQVDTHHLDPLTPNGTTKRSNLSTKSPLASFPITVRVPQERSSHRCHSPPARSSDNMTSAELDQLNTHQAGWPSYASSPDSSPDVESQAPSLTTGSTSASRRESRIRSRRPPTQPSIRQGQERWLIRQRLVYGSSAPPTSYESSQDGAKLIHSEFGYCNNPDTDTHLSTAVVIHCPTPSKRSQTTAPCLQPTSATLSLSLSDTCAISSASASSLRATAISWSTMVTPLSTRTLTVSTHVVSRLVWMIASAVPLPVFAVGRLSASTVFCARLPPDIPSDWREDACSQHQRLQLPRFRSVARWLCRCRRDLSPQVRC